MVKLKGPALSARALGSLADTVTFSSIPGRSYLKKKPTPKQPRSGKQLSMRAMMSFLSKQWANLLDSEQDSWVNAYPDPELPNYNKYLRHNLERWYSLRSPSEAYPPAYIGSIGLRNLISWTGGVRHADFAYSLMALNANWGLCIFRHTASPVPCDYQHLTHVMLMNIAGPSSKFTDTPLTPGTYYWKHRLFTTDGTLGPAADERSAVVT